MNIKENEELQKRTLKMNLKEAAQQALEALDLAQALSERSAHHAKILDAYEALRAALAEDAMQRLTDVQQEMEATCQECRQVEPVAWINYNAATGCETIDRDCHSELASTPLYATPPSQRKPLTDEQISEIFISHGRDKETFARAIERAHGIGGEE